jgi:hypothetical protein
VSADAGLEPASSRRSYAPRGDDREWFDRLVRSISPALVLLLVNASSAQRVILRMTPGERHRGSQLNRRTAEQLSFVVHQSAVLGGALDAVPCGRRPNARSVGRGGERRECRGGTDVMMSTYACAIPASTIFE